MLKRLFLLYKILDRLCKNVAKWLFVIKSQLEDILMEKNIDLVKLTEENIEIKKKQKINETDQSIFFIFTKRLIDILGSIFGLLILSPLFLIIAIAIKKDGKKEPVFFSQVRIGKNGKKFQMYKFRSMSVNAEAELTNLIKYNEVEGPMFKIKNDPRVTRVGKFIRKTSIDELPQLWNVFKGDMSLVGPRPPLAIEVSSYTIYDMQRLLVKPGCTGVWQISGRNHVGFNEMVQMDINYINNLSIKNDLKIIFKTLIIMVKPNGAY